jgi:hypothetical protein
MTSYFLARDVHLCVQGEGVFFLDVASGKYFGLGAREAAALATEVCGWPLSADRTDTSASSPALQLLVERGLLTRDPALGKPATPLMRAKPSSSVLDIASESRARMRWRHVWYFLVSYVYAIAALRWIPLRKILERTSRRKAQGTTRTSASLDLEDIRGLMQVCARLRPFVYGRDHTCMLHCLIMTEFFARFGVFPDWVFGVRSSPFRAHCWLEYGGKILTDPRGRVDRMTPIMAV